MKFEVAKRLKALKGVSPLLAAIILIAGTIAGSLLVYTLYFSSANTAAATSLVSVSPMLMKAGNTAKLALNFKNIGTKPVVKIEYTFNGEETQVLDVEVPPGQQVSTVFTPAHPENFIVGNNYLLVVKATYSDGSTSTDVLSVMCSGWGGPSGLPGGEEEEVVVVETIVNTSDLTEVGEIIYEDTIKAGYQFMFVAVGEAEPDAPGNTAGTISLELQDINGVWQEQVYLRYGSWDNDERPYFYFSPGGYEYKTSYGSGGSGSTPLTYGLGWDEYGIDFPWKFPLAFRLRVTQAFTGTSRNIKIYLIYVKGD